MIDWKNYLLIQDDLGRNIKHLTVMFQTPVGLMDDAKQALQWCEENNMEFHLCINAVAVARDITGRTEIL
jgi:hypothetical protein